MRLPPTANWGSNSFNSMQFWGKIGKIVCWRPPESWCPHLGEILDPPLKSVTKSKAMIDCILLLFFFFFFFFAQKAISVKLLKWKVHLPLFLTSTGYLLLICSGGLSAAVFTIYRIRNENPVTSYLADSVVLHYGGWARYENKHNIFLKYLLIP